jgi:hypothetical protein
MRIDRCQEKIKKKKESISKLLLNAKAKLNSNDIR